MEVLPVFVKRVMVTRRRGSSELKSRYLMMFTPLVRANGLCMTVFRRTSVGASLSSITTGTPSFERRTYVLKSSQVLHCSDSGG